VFSREVFLVKFFLELHGFLFGIGVLISPGWSLWSEFFLGFFSERCGGDSKSVKEIAYIFFFPSLGDPLVDLRSFLYPDGAAFSSLSVTGPESAFRTPPFFLFPEDDDLSSLEFIMRIFLPGVASSTGQGYSSPFTLIPFAFPLRGMFRSRVVVPYVFSRQTLCARGRDARGLSLPS